MWYTGHDEEVTAGRDSRARKRCGFGELQVLRNRDEVVLVHDHFFRQHAIDARSGYLGGLLGCRGAIEPIREVRRGHAIPNTKARYLRADGHDFACPVCNGYRGVLTRNWVVTTRDHEVAIIERHGMHADLHFTRGWHRGLAFETLEGVLAPAKENSVCLHG